MTVLIMTDSSKGISKGSKVKTGLLLWTKELFSPNIFDA